MRFFEVKCLRGLLLLLLYILIVAGAYYFRLTLILSFFSLPWSIPLMMFGGLIDHVTVQGEDHIRNGKILGASINALFFSWLVLRCFLLTRGSTKPEEEIENFNHK